MPSNYTATLIVGTDPRTGKKIRKKFCGKTQREANSKRDEYRYQMKHGISTYDFITFQEVAEEWLELTKEDIVSESTYHGYEVCIGLCNNAFGKCAIQSITNVDLNRLLKKNKDKSESYMNKLKITIRAIFKYAYESEYTPKNPSSSMLNLNGKKPDKKETYSEDEMREVLEYSKNHHYGLGVFIILKTGLRCGELMGLKTSDFDFKTKRLYVVRTAVNSSSSEIIKIGGKTENAVRTIPLDDETVEYLKTREEFQNDRFVFLSTKTDRPIAPTNYSRRRHAGFMKDLQNDKGIRSLNPHYLRHTYGTHLFRLGNDLFKIMKIMGHSSIETTRKIYIHDTIDDLEKGLIL